MKFKLNSSLGADPYLSGEAAAEETPGLTKAVEKPKGGVNTENNDYVN